MEKEKFEKKLKNAMCIDMEKIMYKGSLMNGMGMNIVVMACKQSSEPGSP